MNVLLLFSALLSALSGLGGIARPFAAERQVETRVAPAPAAAKAAAHAVQQRLSPHVVPVVERGSPMPQPVQVATEPSYMQRRRE